MPAAHRAVVNKSACLAQCLATRRALGSSMEFQTAFASRGVTGLGRFIALFQLVATGCDWFRPRSEAHSE
jgi:hypothetical protein